MAASFIYGRKIPVRVMNTNNFIGGIADYEKLGSADTYAHGRSIDVRSDPRGITILPASVKESGSVITDLPIWSERVLNRVALTSVTYSYGQTGNIYARSSTGSHSLIRTVAASHGNGLRYYGEDDYLYYPSDKSIGRYGPVSSATPNWVDDWLTTQGGVPTNTYSISLLSASSMYATAADSATLSQTGSLTLESYFNPTTLPTVGNSMTLVGKWDESGALRSYKLDIYAVSGYFGDGSDGALTIAADTTEAPIDATCTGTSGASTLAATNVSFATGQVIMIHQSQGTGAGSWMRNVIQGYTAGTITLQSPLNTDYVFGSQVRVLKQYSAVTINSGKTYTAKAWTGSVGGIISFLCSGTVTGTGSISASGVGFRGASSNTLADNNGLQGEGSLAAGGTRSTSSNGNGAGGGTNSGGLDWASAGGGGGNATIGTVGGNGQGVGGVGGSTAGTTDLTTMVFGGGGSSGGMGRNSSLAAEAGAAGGGIVYLTAAILTVTGTIVANGAVGTASSHGSNSGGGGGAGGSILLKAQTTTLGSGLVTASGGAGGTGGAGSNNTGGAGGDGRVHLDYYTSYTGSTTPTLNVTQDNTLVTNTTYQARLGISNDGTANEYLTKPVAITTGLWWHVAVSWVASTSTATFYLNGTSQGTTVGTKTAIHDNTSLLYVGANKGASVVQNFFNGLIDETRVWGSARSSSDIAAYMNRQLGGTEATLKAYYQYNNSAADTTGTNNLTLVNTPTYSQNVSFSAPTTRLDIDLTATNVGNTYTTPLAIDESTSAKASFLPTKDPQKSIDFNIASKGTGNWTVTVHDPFNNVVATSTVTNANLVTGFYEFTYANVWRPVIGATYHAHITSTVADGTVVTLTASNLSTLGYHTYYQFLVSDVYHPSERVLNAIVWGNERYVAFWDASTYNPMRLKFPSGTRVRCIAKWREYWAFGCWYYSAITDCDLGIIFLWDGSSVTYNAYVEIPQGGVNAMFGQNDTLYIMAGYRGDLLMYNGGQSATKVKKMPKMVKSPTSYMEVFPGSMTMWQGLLRIGVSGNADSTLLEKGVYTYGALNAGMPESITYDHPISTGNRGSTVKIGAITALDRKLLIGWQDGTAFGIDVVDTVANSPYSSATVELPITDMGVLWKEKKANAVRADFLPLKSGESVDIKYKINRATNWTNLGAITTVGATKAFLQLPAPDERHKEVQVAADLFTTTTTAPTLTELSFQEDLLLDEQNYG